MLQYFLQIIEGRDTGMNDDTLTEAAASRSHGIMPAARTARENLRHRWCAPAVLERGARAGGHHRELLMVIRQCLLDI
jgi:NAD(P)H-dependent flavin oxidoreductase YrpB (nitropropane dioxygenase family)